MKNINEIMLNPIRMRIIQELSHGQSITATELCERISDVPRTTLYRHIKILIDNNILSVVSEKKSSRKSWKNNCFEHFRNYKE